MTPLHESAALADPNTVTIEQLRTEVARLNQELSQLRRDTHRASNAWEIFRRLAEPAGEAECRSRAENGNWRALLDPNQRPTA